MAVRTYAIWGTATSPAHEEWVREVGKQFEKDAFRAVDDVAEADFVLNMFDAADPKAFRRASRGTYSAAFYELPASAAPVLLFSGGLDPVTPPRHGERVAKALGAKARHVVVDNAGHGVMSLGCARDLIHRFIGADDDADALAIDAGCLAAIPRPPVFRPADAALPASPVPGGRP